LERTIGVVENEAVKEQVREEVRSSPEIRRVVVEGRISIGLTEYILVEGMEVEEMVVLLDKKSENSVGESLNSKGILLKIVLIERIGSM
jgi:hypothetical protein